MRRGIFALAMLALAVPGAAAQADPPWARDHGPELHAAYCGPEIKGGPNGGAQPRCAARLVYAGGPPPWAPAHGWRRKHKHHHEPEVRYAEVGREIHEEARRRMHDLRCDPGGLTVLEAEKHHIPVPSRLTSGEPLKSCVGQRRERGM